MVRELDIVGEFLYDAMIMLRKMKNLENETEVFYFLYHASVGIERLQKILLVLLQELDEQTFEIFEKDLITHSHQELNTRIVSTTNLKFDSKENSFFQLLEEFYKSCRYNRFNLFGGLKKEKDILEKFLIGKLNQKYKKNPWIGEYIEVTPQVKKQLGKIMKSIAQKYYNQVKKCAHNQNLHTYELKTYSKAYSVFLGSDERRSLYDISINEDIAYKELLIYLINSSDSKHVRGFMEGIDPLCFDEALVNDYLCSILNKDGLQELVDQVSELYADMEDVGDRLILLSPIGNPNCYFDSDDEL